MAPQSRFSKLALICLISTIVPSASALTVALSAAQALGVLERRQDSCPNDFKRCPDTKLPSNFCCPADATCISLDTSTTVLCCPKDADCSKIQPVSCNLNFQDASKEPNALVKTTRLKDKQDSCGQNTCCPFGYTCENGSTCVIDKATSSTGRPTASSSASSTATESSASPTSTVAGIASQQGSLCPRFPGGAIAVGFFPGLFAGAILALIGVILLGRHNPQENRPYSKGSGGTSSHKYSDSFTRGRGANGTITGISGPIPMQGGARTDFLRRQSTMLRNGGYRAKSWFGNDKSISPLNPVNHWKMPTPPVPNNIPVGPIGHHVPITPPSQIRHTANTHASSIAREPSTESIKVYSPPSMVHPASKSGFSPQEPVGFKQSMMSKLSPKLSGKFSPFKGTELRARNASQASNGPPTTDPMPYESHPAFQAQSNIHPAFQAQSNIPPAQPLPPAAVLAPVPSPYADYSHSETDSPQPPPLPNASYNYQTPQIPAPLNTNRPGANPHASLISPTNAQNQFLPPPGANNSLNLPLPPHLRDPSTLATHSDLNQPPSRPMTHMTTFTDVLRDAGIESRDSRPDVPPLPAGPSAWGGKGGKKGFGAGAGSGPVMGGKKWGVIDSKSGNGNGSSRSRSRSNGKKGGSAGSKERGERFVERSRSRGRRRLGL